MRSPAGLLRFVLVGRSSNEVFCSIPGWELGEKGPLSTDPSCASSSALRFQPSKTASWVRINVWSSLKLATCRPKPYCLGDRRRNLIRDTTDTHLATILVKEDRKRWDKWPGKCNAFGDQGYTMKRCKVVAHWSGTFLFATWHGLVSL